MNSRNLLVVAASLLSLAVPTGVARASVVTFPATSPFVAGTTIRAADVNGAFTAVKTAVDDNATRLTAAESTLSSTAAGLASTQTALTAATTRLTAAESSLTASLARVTALESANAARKSYYVEQTFDGNSSVDDIWVNLPAVAIPLTFTAPTTIRYQLFARVYNYGAAAGTSTNCSVRIVQDDAGTALIPPAFPATLGDWNGVLTGGDTTPNNGHQVALGGLALLPAGTYNFKVQVVRKAQAGNSGSCSVFRWSFSRARFFVNVVP